MKEVQMILNNKDREWYIFDAKDFVLGRLSTSIADILRGKKKITFANNTDTGDYVVVINAEQIQRTGNKKEQTRSYKHTGYIGNLKVKTVPEQRKSKPEEIIKHAVKG